jgi:brefeldin A-inhibited guanine nucleotide-exchange protein
MRSKLLSLHLIHIIVNNHFGIFFTSSPALFSSPIEGPPLFILAAKQFFCLSLSRNSASVIPQVFDTAMDIFGKALVGLRSVLKVYLLEFILG